MKSILQLAAEAQTFGGIFVRDPWTGHVEIERCAEVPLGVLRRLRQRWGDLEAVLAEQSPVVSRVVGAAERTINREFA